ncbi:MAG: NADH-quinone oxidoreductase subunit H [Abditibacteriota bacterium]|nr:NADH-quinone oxidoreductase subunit H [Abditibacteriota bacterium]
MINIITIIITVLFAPLAGAVITGVDRRITARFQSRIGPPVLQPIYDVLKLLGKERVAVNAMQIIYVIGSLVFAILSLLLFVLRSDYLILVFVLAFSTVSLIVGATSVRSPYSKIGAQREIIQILAYEPVIILMVVGMYLVTGSFNIGSIAEHEGCLFAQLPLVFVAFCYVLTIKLRKSPFDYSTSHHGHQELIKGLTTEFSGLQLALIEITHWYEAVLFIGMLSLFFAHPLWLGILIALGVYFCEIILDNVCARTTWQWMLRFTVVLGFSLAMTNIIWLYLKY